MRASAICIVGLVLGLALGAGPARLLAQDDGSIVIRPAAVNSNGTAGATYFDSCGVHVTAIANGFLGIAILRVYARLSGISADGISGADFYIDGLETGAQLPTGWTKTVTPAAGTITLGDISDPHTSGGDIARRYNLTWDVSGPESPNCQKDPLVLLAQVECRSSFGFSTNFSPGHRIQVVVSNPPSNPTHTTPILVQCNFPVFSPIVITGSEFVLNGDCSTAVKDMTWSRLKGLYR